MKNEATQGASEMLQPQVGARCQIASQHEDGGVDGERQGRGSGGQVAGIGPHAGERLGVSVPSGSHDPGDALALVVELRQVRVGGQVPDGALPPQDLEPSDLSRRSSRSFDHRAPAHDRCAYALIGEDMDDVGEPDRLAVPGLLQQRELAAVADPHRAREARPQARH